MNEKWINAFYLNLFILLVCTHEILKLTIKFKINKFTSK